MKRTWMRPVGMLAGVLVVLALWACGDSDPASTAIPAADNTDFLGPELEHGVAAKRGGPHDSGEGIRV